MPATMTVKQTPQQLVYLSASQGRGQLANTAEMHDPDLGPDGHDLDLDLLVPIKPTLNLAWLGIG